MWLKGQKYLYQNHTQSTKSISILIITQNKSQCFCKPHISVHVYIWVWNDPFSVSPQLLTLSSTRNSSLRLAWLANPVMTSRRPSASLTRTRVASLRRTSWSRHRLLVFTLSLSEPLAVQGSSFFGPQWIQNVIVPKSTWESWAAWLLLMSALTSGADWHRAEERTEQTNPAWNLWPDWVHFIQKSQIIQNKVKRIQRFSERLPIQSSQTNN